MSNLVYDVGMHLGQDSAYYLHRGYRVVAVEANPLLAQQGRDRFRREIEAGQLVLENVGIAAASGTAEFWMCDDMPNWSSFNREHASRRGYRHHAVQIRCAPITELFERHGTPHYLKVNIVGHDEVCLAQLSPGNIPSYISVESYGVKTVDDLARLGYRQFKVIDQVCFRPLTYPPDTGYRLYWWMQEQVRRSLHVRSAYGARLGGKLGGRSLAGLLMRRYRMHEGYVFEDGASGSFGEDAPGGWRPAEEARQALGRFTDWFKQTGTEHVLRWFDVHAKK